MLKDNYERVLSELGSEKSRSEQVFRQLEQAEDYIQKCQDNIQELTRRLNE